MSDSIRSTRTRRKTLRLRDPMPSEKNYAMMGSSEWGSIGSKSDLYKSSNSCTKSKNNYDHRVRRSASLDSLNNSTDADSYEDNDAAFSDSDAEIAHITGTTSVQVHRRSDLEELQNNLSAETLTANIQLSECDCEIVDMIRKDVSNSNEHLENYDEVSRKDSKFLSSAGTVSSLSSVSSSIRNRKTSITSSGSVGRMETIIEESIEPKISVKEILARFETLNSTEMQSKASTLSSGARAAAQTLNVPLERLEASRDRETNQHMYSTGVPIATETGGGGGADAFEKQLSHRTEHIGIRNINHSGAQHLISSQNPHSIHHGTVNVDHVHEDQNDSHLMEKQSDQMASRKSSAANHHDLSVLGHADDESMLERSQSVSKYSLLQFAMQHFRNDHNSDDHRVSSGTATRGEKRISSTRSHIDLVKWQGVPIRSPLLRLPSDLAPMALECFNCILRYCGDISPDAELTEVKCVYTVLMHCHKYLALRDEVYCQLMKQTTTNRSPCPDSSQRAWRLLSILAAYFGCSEALRPYLIEHLTTAASDRRRSCHGTAAVCLTNLRKTARCGGRKNVPSVEEVTAVSAGRSARRQIYRLPGGAERVVNTRCSTVVADVISELCALLGIDSEVEQQEFSLYCIVQGDAFTMPLAADEYILDVTTELLKSGQPFYLIFCRSVWHFPLKRDPVPTPLYIEVLFNQVAPDYLEGLLLELPSNGAPPPEVMHDMARIAALLHRAADLNHVPAMKEIKFLLPKPALGIREMRPPQWVTLVQSAWPSIVNLSPAQVKAQFLGVLSSWLLFGSSFFAVKRIWSEDGSHVEESNSMWKDLILALNRRGVHFLEPNTHETMQHWPFMEVISTRKVRSEDGALFLDMKVGNLMQQRVIRVQTEQAHEISRLVRQYITMAQICQRDRKD